MVWFSCTLTPPILPGFPPAEQPAAQPRLQEIYVVGFCREVGAALQQDQPSEDAQAVVPEVAFLHDKPVGPKTEQRHPCQILGAAIRQPGLRTPGHGRLITVDNRHAKLALRRILLGEYAG
jgi:hypothetical protein